MAEKVFPEDVVEDAKTLCANLDRLDSNAFEVCTSHISALGDGHANSDSIWQDAIEKHKKLRQHVQLVQRLQCLRYASTLTEDGIRQYITYLQVLYVHICVLVVANVESFS